MNVLFLTDLDPYAQGAVGGAETSIRLLADRFAARGHHTVYATKAQGWVASTSRPTLRDGGVRHVTLTTLRGRARSRHLAALRTMLLDRALAGLIVRNDTQVAYAFYEFENLQALLRVRAKLGYPRVVLRMAGLRWYRDCVRRPELATDYERLFNEIDAVNFIHEDLERMTREKLAELGMRVVFRNRFIGDIGSSVAHGAGRASKRDGDAPFRIIMASRFSDYQKRQDLLVDAASRLDPQLRISIELIGDGPTRASIQARIDQLGVADKVTIVPFLPQADLWARMREADLMCHACDYEGLGKILIESMAIGLPVLASNVPPLDRLIADGTNGFLVDNDPRSWASRIEWLVGANDAMAKVSHGAVAFVKREYDSQENIRLYEDAFRALVEGRSLP